MAVLFRFRLSVLAAGMLHHAEWGIRSLLEPNWAAVRAPQFMCIYIYIYAYVYIYIYVYRFSICCLYRHAHVCRYVYVHVYIYTYINAYLCVHRYSRIKTRKAVLCQKSRIVSTMAIKTAANMSSTVNRVLAAVSSLEIYT